MRLLISPEVNLMLRYAAEFNPGLEVAGFGRTLVAENNEDVVVTDIYIPPQEVKTAHADIKGPGEAGGDGMLENAIQHFAQHCGLCGSSIQEHEANDHDFAGMSWTDWRLWWHSHGRIGATPSHTDDTSLRTLAKYLDGWSIGLVVNAAGERHAWAAVQQGPFNLIMKELEVGYLRQHDQAIKDRVDAMMQEVREWKYTQTPTQGRQPQQGSTTRGAGTGNTSRPAPVELPALPEGKRLVDLSKEEFAQWLHSEVAV